MSKAIDLLIALGPPNSGKGTQAARIGKNLGLVHLSSGDVFRKAIADDTALGQQAKRYLDAGELVPDDITCRIILDRLEDLGRGGSGAILDGFPRTLEQAQALQTGLEGLTVRLRAVIFIDVGDQAILQRAALRGREDDRPAIVSHRLEVYRKLTRPLVEFYETLGLLVRIDGEQSIDAVGRQISEALEARVP